VLILTYLPHAFGAGDNEPSGKLPIYSGERAAFTAWFIIFSAYFAKKLTDASDILAGQKPPVVPAMQSTHATPNGTVTYTNASQVAKAKDNLAVWNTNNKRLYGLLIQALPDNLRVSVFNAHDNYGIGAATYLHTLFAVKKGSANDYSVQCTRLQASVIDDKADIDVADLRLQFFDSMTTATTAIQRIGRTPPDNETLMVFFDNALPISYSQVRQTVRDKKHTTF
jgi:hypothetical protein